MHYTKFNISDLNIVKYNRKIPLMISLITIWYNGLIIHTFQNKLYTQRDKTSSSPSISIENHPSTHGSSSQRESSPEGIQRESPEAGLAPAGAHGYSFPVRSRPVVSVSLCAGRGEFRSGLRRARIFSCKCGYLFCRRGRGTMAIEFVFAGIARRNCVD